ncbi:putative hydrolase [Planctomycetes bacterium CA13]|uniref:Putative hydrolase n=1 Tax=Novipirellula herctigrandis TaxID=2527986 RepID=A0A5C5YXB5_9BACT|nr:putative hydrolase [Planctomycetes bacterium CA13]
MFNRLLDRAVNKYVSFAMRKYRTYPAARTAVLFVNVQQAFACQLQGIMPGLLQLHTLAREKGVRIVHAPYGGHSQHYPSPAQIRLTELLDSTPNGREIPLELAAHSCDIVLRDRPSLSCFMKTDLRDQLQESEIEHLVVAGPYANLAIDSTVRDGVQFGLHVTVLSDCVSAESASETQAVQVTLPRYAQTVISLKKFQSLIVDPRVTEGLP